MNFNKNTVKNIMLIITFTVLLFVGLQNIKMVTGALQYVIGLLAPFLIGGCLAFILNVPMRFFETKVFSSTAVSKKHPKLMKMKRALSLVLTFVAVVGVMAIAVYLVVPGLTKSFGAIQAEMSNAKTTIPNWLDMASQKLPVFAAQFEALKTQFLDVNWQKIGETIASFLENGSFLSDTYTFATSVVSGVTNFIIGLVFAVYVLMQKEKLGRQFRRIFYSFFPEKRVDRFLGICTLTSNSFNSFLSGQCLEACILGMMFFLSMTVLRMDYALVISVLIAVTALIPMFGAFIGLVVGVVLILIVDPIEALWFIVLFFVLQQIEGNLIYPHVVGHSVGLPSLWVLMAVTLGANLAGVLGMLFAIPVFSVIYSLLRESVKTRIQERAIDEDKIS